MPNMPMVPTLHNPVPMGQRVLLPDYYGKDVRGEVVGISHVHVIFTYIVLLDDPIDSDYGPQRAVPVTGGELRSEDGKTDWKKDLTNAN